VAEIRPSVALYFRRFRSRLKPIFSPVLTSAKGNSTVAWLSSCTNTVSFSGLPPITLAGPEGVITC
jgi:hypothetical protein